MRIHFDARLAQEVRENHWHESEQYIEQSDGSVIMELEIGDTDFLKRWILGFGRHVKVLEPPELREELLNEIEMMKQHCSTP